jgi:hypothetical protein
MGDCTFQRDPDLLWLLLLPLLLQQQLVLLQQLLHQQQQQQLVVVVVGLGLQEVIGAESSSISELWSQLRS